MSIKLSQLNLWVKIEGGFRISPNGPVMANVILPSYKDTPLLTYSLSIPLAPAAYDHSKQTVYALPGSTSHNDIVGVYDLPPSGPEADIDEVVYGFITKDARFYNRAKMLEILVAHHRGFLKKHPDEIDILNSFHIDWEKIKTSNLESTHHGFKPKPQRLQTNLPSIRPG